MQIGQFCYMIRKVQQLLLCQKLIDTVINLIQCPKEKPSKLTKKTNPLKNRPDLYQEKSNISQLLPF
jgi:hypothetical protein